MNCSVNCDFGLQHVFIMVHQVHTLSSPDFVQCNASSFIVLTALGAELLYAPLRDRGAVSGKGLWWPCCMTRLDL